MFDPLMGTGNYSAISATLKSIDYNVAMTFILNNNKNIELPSGGLLHLVQRGDWGACSFNPLDSKGNYSATSNNTKLVHWPLMSGLLHLVQRGGAWAGWGPAQPSTASVPITVLLYDGPLVCGFNVAIKGLMYP